MFSFTDKYEINPMYQHLLKDRNPTDMGRFNDFTFEEKKKLLRDLKEKRSGIFEHPAVENVLEKAKILCDKE